VTGATCGLGHRFARVLHVQLHELAVLMAPTASFSCWQRGIVLHHGADDRCGQRLDRLVAPEAR
jgi:hypothetical protein